MVAEPLLTKIVADKLASPFKFADNTPSPERFPISGTSIPRFAFRLPLAEIEDSKPSEADIEADNSPKLAKSAERAARSQSDHSTEPSHPKEADIVPP